MDAAPAPTHIAAEDARQRLSKVIGRPLLPLSQKDFEALERMTPVERTRWALERARAQDVVTTAQLACMRKVHPAAPGPEETDEDRRALRNARKRERKQQKP